MPPLRHTDHRHKVLFDRILPRLRPLRPHRVTKHAGLPTGGRQLRRRRREINPDAQKPQTRLRPNTARLGALPARRLLPSATPKLNHLRRHPQARKLAAGSQKYANKPPMRRPPTLFCPIPADFSTPATFASRFIFSYAFRTATTYPPATGLSNRRTFCRRTEKIRRTQSTSYWPSARTNSAPYRTTAAYT